MCAYYRTLTKPVLGDEMQFARGDEMQFASIRAEFAQSPPIKKRDGRPYGRRNAVCQHTRRILKGLELHEPLMLSREQEHTHHLPVRAFFRNRPV